MAELSDSFKQLDTVGKLRYKEKLGMLGGNHRSIQYFKHMTSMAGPLSVFFEAYHKGSVNHDSSTPQLRRRISTTLHRVNMLYISIHSLDITTRGICLALPF